MVVLAVVDRTQTEEAQERLRAALALAVGIGAVLAAGVATVVARRAVRPLVAVIAQQRRFVADASHELRTPLTLLSTRAQLLARRHRRRDEGPEVVDGLDALVRDVDVLSLILDDLLLAADPEGDRVWETVAVADLAKQVRESAQAHATSRGVDVVLTVGPGRRGEEPEPEPDTRVAAVPVALRRAITALLDGGIDHATARVDVQVRRDGSSVVVLVEDDGPGVPGLDDADRQLVFARFHHRPAVTDVDGARPHHGLGLALVAEVVQMHGGTVRVTHRDDGCSGAVFTIRLPAA
ncbi:MAG: HAMP domain-containing histidine kinase [Actinomycetota bacterium]|nr:HAMP domain-containing histidine kinase [Actinomycetota bacterium]